MAALRDRVKRRIDELRRSPITLAKSVGLERGFINDILIGRKKTVRDEKLELVAKALECDPAYLMGFQDVVRIGNPTQLGMHAHVIPGRSTLVGPGLPVRGAAQSDVWRGASHAPDLPPTMPVAADPRFAHLPQFAYIIPISSQRKAKVALAIETALYEKGVRPIDDGAVVVIQREKAGLTETSLRIVGLIPERTLFPFPDDPAGFAIPLGLSGWPDDIKVVAVITNVQEIYF